MLRIPSDPKRLAHESAEWQRRFQTTYTVETCSHVLYQAWEDLLEEYLVEERIWVKSQMEAVALKWEEDVSHPARHIENDGGNAESCTDAPLSSLACPFFS